MRAKRQRLKLVPLGDPKRFNELVMFESEDLTLREFLKIAPAFGTEPINESVMDYKLGQLMIDSVDGGWDRPLFRPPGMVIDGSSDKELPVPPESIEKDEISADQKKADVREDQACASAELKAPQDDSYPDSVSDKTAVQLAYALEIENAASFLRAGLSVLVVCDKLVVDHLWCEIARRAFLMPVLLAVPDEDGGGLVPRGLRQRQLAYLKELINGLKEGDVLVIPHLDLLAGGDSSLQTETRELIELVYEASDRLVLAFADRSLAVPEVLASRFAGRLLISGVSRSAVYPDGEELPIGRALITASEVERFEGYDPEGLYKNVAGMNPVRLRHAIKYAVKEYAEEGVVPVNRLYQAIRAFKAQTSANFEVPDVTFKDIGGYDAVKAELVWAIRLMTGSYSLPNEKLRSELIPRGFIFYGPPGTGKTLFAKAVANQLNATIQVVSGPEVTDMYVGESERKVRELFAEARRNAPAVLVFDEFDSIATKRSGRDDGGSRAGNAIVAQILTEMDGFRPDVPMLVIGTTNRLDIIDEALLRPSRFKAVNIGLPDLAARRAIAQVHSRHFEVNVSPELLEVIASATEGMSGDDVRSLFRDACVGLNCQDEPIPADAHRFGALVGALRRATEQRAGTVAAHRESALQGLRHGERPTPTGPMVSLISSESDVSEPSDDITN